MTARAASRSHLLLFNPAQAQWLDAQGQASAAPAGTVPVRVVADLVEETHVRIDVPAIMGGDRKNYIQVQTQAQLPDVPLRASWEPDRAQPLLPRPFGLHVVGVSSAQLLNQLGSMAQAGQPIEGVWTLSYLMAHWAVRHPATVAEHKVCLLCLGLPYGMRMVLLQGRVPVFSRLLLETDATLQAREVALTLKYLADNRIIERDVQPAVLALQPEPLLWQGLQNQGLKLLPAAQPRRGASLLAEVLAQTGPRAPGQLAGHRLRRHHLAQRVRQGLYLATALVALAGLAGLALQAQTLLGGAEQSRQWQAQTQELTHSAQALRAELARRQVNVPLLRLALQVQRTELQAGIDPAPTLWQLGQVLQAQPQAQLVGTALALRPQPCAASSAGAEAPAAPSEPAPEPQADAAPPLEWQFSIRPEQDLSPRQRQALLEALAQAVSAWPQWQVHTNPLRQESAAVLSGGQSQGGVDAQAATWQWCLAPRAPQAVQGAPS